MINWLVLNDVMAWLLALKTDLIKQKNLFYLLLLAVGAIVAFGTTLYFVDPNINSIWDGLWFAWSALTMVGFGDVVPTSLLGRIFASFLLVIGILLLALLNATFSAALIGRGVTQVERDVTQVEKEESLILQEIKRLHERLDKLEERSK
ncbi:potassium channel family protein [Methyloglobulus sp.]|uniref:potassium channel family protein n=1 Tax=Methyloglobulus sp. TaxID=2518622 RepID=UPI0032B8524C